MSAEPRPRVEMLTQRWTRRKGWRWRWRRRLRIGSRFCAGGHSPLVGAAGGAGAHERALALPLLVINAGAAGQTSPSSSHAPELQEEPGITLQGDQEVLVVLTAPRMAMSPPTSPPSLKQQ